ncbi:MAG: sugar transferase, partial [Terriglobales bacterium]
MIKVLNQYFPRRWAVLLLGESLLILLALAIAVAVQEGGWPDSASLGLAWKAILITLVCQLCLHYSDLYEPNAQAAGGQLLARLMQALGTATLMLALVYWLFPQARLSTGLVAGSVVGLIVLLMGWRRAMDAAMFWAQHAYPGGQRLLVVGTGPRAAQLVEEIRQRPQLGLDLLGCVGEAGASAGSDHVSLLGRMDDLDAVIATQRPQRIVLALEERRGRLPLRPLLTARTQGIRIEESPTLLERVTGRVALDSLRPSWMILSDGFRKSVWLRIYQRGTSLLGAVLGLILLSPVLLLVAIAVKLDSRGPVIYKQTRIGVNGRSFEIFKFRSMRQDAETASGPVWAQERDPRITRVGNWLRKLRLDELPQLFNV